MTRVGFIGVGTMGRPMSGHLVKCGFALTLYDQDTARAGEVAALWGCKAVPSLSGLGACEFIVTMLPDGKAVADVLTRAQGQALIKACKPGTIFIDMSSSEPLITRETGATLARHGMTLVDAPVSGTRTRAESATLTIMIGCGDEGLLEKVRPVLSAMGDRLFVVGGLGTGHAMKALNNYVSVAGLVATAEALVIGQRFGLDGHVMTRVLNASTGKNNTTENKVERYMLSHAFNSGFTLALMEKDIGMAKRLADSLGLKAEELAAVHPLIGKAIARLGKDADHTAIYDYVLKTNPPAGGK